MKHIIKQILKEEEQKQNIFVPYNLEKRREDYEKRLEQKLRPAKEEFKEMLLKYQVDLSLGNKIYYDENGDWVFEYDSKNKWLWIQYHRIWSVFESKYGLNYNQIRKLTEDTVREVYKMEGVTTTEQLLFLHHLGERGVQNGGCHNHSQELGVTNPE